MSASSEISDVSNIYNRYVSAMMKAKTKLEFTTVALRKETLEQLKRQGTKGESYEALVRRLLAGQTGAGIVTTDPRWNPLNDPRLGSDGRHLVMAVRHRSVQETVLQKLKDGSLKEQWEVPVGLTPAPAARLRYFVVFSDQVVGAAGETVTVPFVKDFDLDILPVAGQELTPKTGLVGTVQTTLKEAGATTDISYADLEKMSPGILTELEGRFIQAAYRAEDKELLDVLYASTDVPELDKSADDPATFPASYIAEALGVMGTKGKEIALNDCSLVLNWTMYDSILKDIAAKQSLAWAKPEAIRSGVVGEVMGVFVLVSGHLPSGGTPAKYSAYLIHRNSAVLAPKRELLMETEKKPRDRIVQVTGSHTFGREILDAEAAVEIKTAFLVS
jgi:hypothetical protein